MVGPRREEYDFHFDELVWRTDAGAIHQAFTELTAIRDNAEFERQIRLIRCARSCGGLADMQSLFFQWATRLIGNLVEGLFYCVLNSLILPIDEVLRFGQKALYFIKKFSTRITGRSD